MGMIYNYDDFKKPFDAAWVHREWRRKFECSWDAPMEEAYSKFEQAFNLKLLPAAWKNPLPHEKELITHVEFPTEQDATLFFLKWA